MKRIILIILAVVAIIAGSVSCSKFNDEGTVEDGSINFVVLSDIHLMHGHTTLIS